MHDRVAQSTGYFRVRWSSGYTGEGKESNRHELEVSAPVPFFSLADESADDLDARMVHYRWFPQFRT